MHTFGTLKHSRMYFLKNMRNSTCHKSRASSRRLQKWTMIMLLQFASKWTPWERTFWLNSFKMCSRKCFNTTALFVHRQMSRPSKRHTMQNLQMYHHWRIQLTRQLLAISYNLKMTFQKIVLKRSDLRRSKMTMAAVKRMFLIKKEMQRTRRMTWHPNHRIRGASTFPTTCLYLEVLITLAHSWIMNKKMMRKLAQNKNNTIMKWRCNKRTTAQRIR
mmetsp:Transcript_5105/g.19149  ORF Transcript_5105/g.19149 Transcript_5105/m.19149 type:complete len:217 (+) Transcript_5105:5093-5743(+)